MNLCQPHRLQGFNHLPFLLNAQPLSDHLAALYPSGTVSIFFKNSKYEEKNLHMAHEWKSSVAYEEC